MTNNSEDLVQNTEFEIPKWAKASLHVLGFFVLYMFVVGLFIRGGNFLGENLFDLPKNSFNQYEKTEPKIMLFGIFMQFLGTFFIIATYWIFVFKKRFIELGFSKKNAVRDFSYGTILGFICIAVGFLILGGLGFLTIDKISFTGSNFYFYLITFLLVSLIEETLTRGFMISALMEGMNKYVALAVTSFIFAALHLFNDNVTMLSIINLILAGFFLGISYVFTKSLWFPIGLHFTWNLFQGPVFGFEVSGHKNISIVKLILNGEKMYTGGEFGFEGSIFCVLIVIIGTFCIYKFYSKENISQSL